MPPKSRGDKKAKAKARNVRFLVEAAKADDSLINSQVENLLAKSGLHKEPKISSAIKAKEGPEAEGPIVPPAQRYPVTAENFVEELSKNVEWAAEMAVMVCKLNMAQPQKMLDTLKAVPVEKWPPLSTTYRQLWNALTIEGVSDAFHEDIKELQETVSKNLRDVGFQSAVNKNDCQWLVRELEEGNSKLHSLWNTLDPDDGIYTDSEDEGGQGEERAPFVEVLRKMLRDIKKQEQVNLIIGSCLRVYDETQNASEVTRHNLNLVTNVLHSEADLKARNLRDQWREWRLAGRVALLNATWGKALLNLGHLDPTEVLQNPSLRHFQLIAEFERVPKSRLCRSLPRHFSQHFPHLIERAAKVTEAKAWAMEHHPFEWKIPRGPILVKPGPDELATDDIKPFKVRMGKPGLRFFLGRAGAIWGSPVGAGYARSSLPSEILFRLKRLSGFLMPLSILPSPPSTKCRPDRFAAESNMLDGDKPTGKQEGGSAALTAAMAFGSEGLGGGRRSGGWGASIRTITEQDSSESEAEAKERIAAAKVDVNSLGSERFHLSGYSHDNDVMRIGRFGRLRSQWDKPKRRRLGLESVLALKGTGCNRPLPPQYSSSEESELGLKDDQLRHRKRSRSSRMMIQKQKVIVNGARKMAKTQKLTRDQEVLSNIYGYGVWPLEETFEPPLRRKDWPGSSLNLYEERQKKELESMTDDQPAGRASTDVSSFNDNTSLNTQEECWTHLSQKKKRVRSFEPRFDRDPKSKAPLGFMATGYEIGNRQYQLVGIDNSELFRRMGVNKFLCNSLSGYGDFLRGCREYYVIINEETQEISVVPGGSMSLFWTKTAKQNLQDMHWYAWWKLWATGRFRRRFGDKALRYLKLRRQGWFIWQQQLDRLGKVADRISEASAYRKAKYIKPRAHNLLQRRELEKKASLNVAYAQSTDEGIDAALSALPVPVEDTNLSDLALTESLPLKEDEQAKSDWEDGEEVTLSRDIAKPNQPLDALAARDGVLNEQNFQSFHYRSMFNRPRNNCPSWAYGWSNSKHRIVRALPERYGHVVSRYYQGILPLFRSQYKEARKMMCEKHEAEAEFAALSKKMQQKRADGTDVRKEV